MEGVDLCKENLVRFGLSTCVLLGTISSSLLFLNDRICSLSATVLGTGFHLYFELSVSVHRFSSMARSLYCLICLME